MKTWGLKRELNGYGVASEPRLAVMDVADSPADRRISALFSDVRDALGCEDCPKCDGVGCPDCDPESDMGWNDDDDDD